MRAGRILDVGVGTGCNIPFYPEGSKVVGIDMSERMLDRARERARELGRPMTLRPMNLLSLDFPDASFDTVSATFVLLCLPDELQEPALRELRRVTKPGGRVLLLDYRRSAKAGAAPVAAVPGAMAEVGLRRPLRRHHRALSGGGRARYHRAADLHGRRRQPARPASPTTAAEAARSAA